MVKKSIVILCLATSLFAGDFESRCVPCHQKESPELENLYFRYMQIYGSEKIAKNAMWQFLSAPSVTKSIMPPQAVSRFGLHKPENQEHLSDTIDEYFAKFSIKNRIKFETKH